MKYDRVEARSNLESSACNLRSTLSADETAFPESASGPSDAASASLAALILVFGSIVSALEPVAGIDLDRSGVALSESASLLDLLPLYCYCTVKK
jgi:hypothetical protein